MTNHLHLQIYTFPTAPPNIYNIAFSAPLVVTISHKRPLSHSYFCPKRLIMAEQQEKTSKDKVFERVRTRRPDWKDDDLDGMYDALDEEYSEMSAGIDRYKANDDKLREMLLSDPEIAGVFYDIMNGANPAVSFVRHFGDRIKDAAEDEQLMKEFEAASAEYKKRVDEENTLRATREANTASAVQAIDSFRQEKGLNDEEMAAFLSELFAILDSFITLDIKPDMLDKLYKAMHYDADVDDAARLGEIKGRNSKIKEEIRRRKGDGVPAAPSAADDTPPVRRPAPQRRQGTLERMGLK